VTVTTPATTGGAPEQRENVVSLTIDGVAVTVPKGTLIIRAAEEIGVAVPRFCDHPLLDPVAACRMCLIEVEGMPKPQPACAVTCGDGMTVRTQMTSPVAVEAQRSVMEFLLINHPLDCPICDKGGECPLQNQAMSNGQGETRFDGPKRTFPKPINLSAQVLLDRERCVSCARCTRFADQIAGDPYIELLDRGSQQQVGIAEGRPFNSYYSGNTIQICPVGALTSAMYRFRSRPFDLVSTPTACEHCASGCSQRTDTRRNAIMRRLAAVDPDVNQEWNCDKGRFAFTYVASEDRLSTPMVRDDGELRPASWAEALDRAASGLNDAQGSSGLIAGGRLSVEDALASSTFARVVLGTNNVDFRARASSDEEEQFLGAHVAGRGLGPTYADLENAPTVLLVAFEPEDESPIVLLRLRKAAAENGTKVFSVGAVASPGLAKMSGQLIAAAPGGEAAVVDALSGEVREAVSQAGSVILVGERAAETSGVLSAVTRLAQATGAALGWVPRRAGDRGAVEAGLLPSLLPGGRPTNDAAARVDAAAVWGVESLPEDEGLSLAAMVDAAADGSLKALVMVGADLADLPGEAESAMRNAFVVALDTRWQGVVDHADVVFPVATAPEKSGTYLNWEGRPRTSRQAIRTTGLMADARVLSSLAEAMQAPIGLADPDAVDRLLEEFDGWSGNRVDSPSVSANASRDQGDGLAVATWQQLLGAGVLQGGEPYLAATARPSTVLLDVDQASRLGVIDGDTLTVHHQNGDAPALVSVVETAEGSVALLGNVTTELRVKSGDRVTLSATDTSLTGGGQ
jgi:NADH-quinone oxidoreductase subunit G